jgi:glyceraldehyde 3-phosphate dehydrogenase
MEKKIRIALNGFGRIGRRVARLIYESKEHENIEIVAINDLGNAATLAHLFEFDSIHGKWNGQIGYGQNHLNINGKKIDLLKLADPEDLNWKPYALDAVIECTGLFKTEEAAMLHVKAGAPRVIISAVASGQNIKTIVLGSNGNLLDGSEKVISNASCTTNCAAPLVDVINQNFGIESGYITTVHSYTSDQSLHDRPHFDLRRARAAALSIIPTTTGAAKAITRVFPELKGNFGGAGIRVPVPNGSLTDITYIVKKAADIQAVNEAFKIASSQSPWTGIMEYTEKPLVSIDVIGNKHSCVYDALLTSVIGNMVKVVGWYDNETGYSARLIDLVKYWSKLWD